jgi:hypothetical protein
MDEYHDIDAGVTILPGVDLALWLQIVVATLIAIAAVTIAIVVG